MAPQIAQTVAPVSYTHLVAAVALSIYTFPVYLGAGFGGLMLGCVVGGLITFVLTYLMGIDEKENA